MKIVKLKQNFVSDIGQFLAELDKTHPKTDAQLREIEQCARVANLRDHAKIKEES